MCKSRLKPAQQYWRVRSSLFLRGGHFAEAAFDEFGEGFDGGIGVWAAGPQSECRTVSGPQRQQVQDAFAVDGLVSLENLHIAGERHGQLDEQVRGPSVKSLRIYE